MQNKRVENETLIALVEQGLTGRQIAEQTSISEAAVSKRLKRIRLQEREPPESFQALTPKKQKFVMGLVQGKTQVNACIDSHDVTSRASARALASRMAREPDVEVALADMFAQEGLSKRRRVQRMSELIESRDSAAVCRMLELSFKLDGSMVERVEHGISGDTIRALIASIDVGCHDELDNVIDITPQ